MMPPPRRAARQNSMTATTVRIVEMVVFLTSLLPTKAPTKAAAVATVMRGRCALTGPDPARPA